jgi:predicted RNase H-like HicB family nuclease
METKASYTAVIQRDGDWWIGWLEEIPGVNSQGHTREELLENLRSALHEALEMNRAEALATVTEPYEEVRISA